MTDIDKMEAGRELDVLVMVEVMEDRPDGEARFSGCNEPEPYIMRDGFPVPWIPKPYSTDWAAAGEVLKRMRALGFEVSLDDDSCGGAPHWRAVFSKNGNRYEYIRTKTLDSYEVKVESPLPLAICLAALIAVRAGKETT